MARIDPYSIRRNADGTVHAASLAAQLCLHYHDHSLDCLRSIPDIYRPRDNAWTRYDDLMHRARQRCPVGQIVYLRNEYWLRQDRRGNWGEAFIRIL